MKKLVSVLLALTFVLSLAACDTDSTSSDNPQSSSSNTSAADPGTSVQPILQANREVNVGISTDPVTWAPWGAYNVGRRDAMPYVYQTLTAAVPDIENGKTITYFVLASGFERIDSNTYEVYIREGIYDSAGNPFTASDAVFSYASAKAQGTLQQLNAISDLEVVDDYTFRIITGKALAVGDIEDLLTGFNMVTQAAYEASPDGMATTPVGTTGYVLENYVSGSSFSFVKADSYWNEAANESKSIVDGYCYVWDCNVLDKINFDVINDTVIMALALQNGDIDISTSVSFADIPLFDEGGEYSDDFSVYDYPENMYAISFNAGEQSVCQNYNLRMALALCVNSSDVLESAFSGVGSIMKAWAYPTYVDYQSVWDTQDYFEYDIDAAREYLELFYKETGQTANTLKLRLLTQSDGTMQKAAQTLQSFIISLVGNANCCELLSYDRATYNQMWLDPTAFDIMLLYTQSINRTYCTYGWNSYANASKNVNGSDVFFDNSDELQSLVNDVISEDTHSDETVLAFQRYINEKAYLKNLCCGNIFIVGRSWISNLEKSVGPKGAIALCGLTYDWSQATSGA